MTRYFFNTIHPKADLDEGNTRIINQMEDLTISSEGKTNDDVTVDADNNDDENEPEMTLEERMNWLRERVRLCVCGFIFFRIHNTEIFWLVCFCSY
jgi:hypothetical protein